MAVSGLRQIGRCQERIALQSATETTSTDGGGTNVWATVRTVWAEFVPIGVNERLQAHALGSETAVRFRIRRRTDVTPEMRVSWTPTFPPGASARTFEIRGVLPVDDGRTWMHLDCTELS